MRPGFEDSGIRGFEVATAVSDERAFHESTNPRILAIALLVALALPAIANACPVCFGDPNSPMTKGTTNAIWFLLGIVGVVQAGFIALFFSFWRRAREARRTREQFRLINGGVQ